MFLGNKNSGIAAIGIFSDPPTEHCIREWWLLRMPIENVSCILLSKKMWLVRKIRLLQIKRLEQSVPKARPNTSKIILCMFFTYKSTIDSNKYRTKLNSVKTEIIEWYLGLFNETEGKLHQFQPYDGVWQGKKRERFYFSYLKLYIWLISNYCSQLDFLEMLLLEKCFGHVQLGVSMTSEEG